MLSQHEISISGWVNRWTERTGERTLCQLPRKANITDPLLNRGMSTGRHGADTTRRPRSKQNRAIIAYKRPETPRTSAIAPPYRRPR